MAVEGLAARDATGAAGGRVSFKAHKARARVAEVRLRVPGPKVVLAVPSTYMNVSGGPVAALLKYCDVPVERLHRPAPTPRTSSRASCDSSRAGERAATTACAPSPSRSARRTTSGSGSASAAAGRQDPADFVLKDFSKAERTDVLPFLIDDAADAVEALIDVGLLDAQQRFTLRADLPVPHRDGAVGAAT